MEPLEYGLLFRWFVGLGVDDEAWDHSCDLCMGTSDTFLSSNGHSESMLPVIRR
jgi:hypothetical protein